MQGIKTTEFKSLHACGEEGSSEPKCCRARDVFTFAGPRWLLKKFWELLLDGESGSNCKSWSLPCRKLHVVFTGMNLASMCWNLSGKSWLWAAEARKALSPPLQPLQSKAHTHTHTHTHSSMSSTQGPAWTAEQNKSLLIFWLYWRTSVNSL